jgi:hypothetical protein
VSKRAVYVELRPGGTATRSFSVFRPKGEFYLPAKQYTRHNCARDWHLGNFEPPPAQSWVTISRPFIALPTTMRACDTILSAESVNIYAKTVPARPSSVLSCSHRWRRTGERENIHLSVCEMWSNSSSASPDPSACIFAAKFICAGDEEDDKRRRNCLKDEAAEPFFIWRRKGIDYLDDNTFQLLCCAAMGENTGNCFSYWKCEGI